MAPITTTTTGIPRQPIDDPELVSLIKRLQSYDCLVHREEVGGSAGSSIGKDDNVDIEGLVGELERVDQWRYTEQVCDRYK